MANGNVNDAAGRKYLIFGLMRRRATHRISFLAHAVFFSLCNFSIFPPNSAASIPEFTAECVRIERKHEHETKRTEKNKSIW